MTEKIMKSLNGYEIVDQHARDSMLDKTEAATLYALKSHNHSASNITSGTLSSDRLPTVPIAKGGTGSTTAAGALSNLGITATAKELNYMDGVTDSVQNQIDSHTGNSTVHVTTAEKTNWNGSLTVAKEYTDVKIQELIGGAPQTLDTLKEISDALNNNPDIIDSLNSAIGNKLSVSGGTMTGILTAKSNQYADAYTGALNMNNSNIYGVNSIITGDVADSAAEGIQWYRDDTHVDSQWVQNGVMYFTPNRALGGTATDHVVLHSGNFSSYITDTNTWRPVVNNLTSTETESSLSAAQGKVLNETKLSLTGGRMTGTLYADKDVVIPSAKATVEGSAPYSGAPTISAITDLYDYKSMIGSVNVTGSGWQGIISLRHRNGAGTGSNYGSYIRTALTSGGDLIWNKQLGNAGTWQGERVILDSSNYSDYALSLSGGTMTGSIKRAVNQSWIKSFTNAALNLENTGFDAAISMPVNSGRVALATYPEESDNVYLAYAPASYIDNETNQRDKLIRWNASDGILYSPAGFNGNLAGNATSATKLETARTIQTDLGSTDAASFNGTANVTPGVKGTLPIANGGTGATTAANALKNFGVTATAAELNHVDGVTSSIQSQLNNRLPLTGGTMRAPIRSTHESNTWLNGFRNATLSSDHTGYGAVIGAPVKNGRISISTYPSSNNYVYLGYASSTTLSSNTNRLDKSIIWDAANSCLHTDNLYVGGTDHKLIPYPVGAVYMSYDGTDPAYLFGGSWAQITGVFPYFSTGVYTGGSNTHVLGVSQMPAHSHRSSLVGNGYYISGGHNWSYGTNNSGYGGGDAANSYLQLTGGSAAHNNMPAYQALFAWRRIA